ncbi:MAG: leucine-rich repeat domain-containing protein [Oscillospiraceae bacterium]|nr:leucine-rich repeat domain-containing protein [Oscillospiraceae bacterium]
MNKARKWLAGISAGLLMLTVSMPAFAEDAPAEDEGIKVGDLTFAETDGGYQLIGAAETVTDVKVPEKVEGEKVVAIGDGAFNECVSLTSVTLPDSLEKIGAGAFYYCMALKELDIPDSVTEIGAYAFANCYALKQITLPESLEVLSSYTFSYDIALEELTLPENLVQIKPMSIASCFLLKTVHIPASVQQIDEMALVANMGLTNIDIAKENNNYTTDSAGAVLSKDGSKLLIYPAGNTAESYDIPAGVAVIDAYAFTSALKLKKVTLPDSVEKIGECAFSGCSSLETFDFPKQLTAIPASLLADCESLSSFVIPDTVTEIGDYAFYGCKALSGVTIPESVTKIGPYAFCGCDVMNEMTVPKSVTEIGDCAFGFELVKDEESGAETPAVRSDFTLAGRFGSAAKTYAEASGVKFKQIGLSPVMVVMIVVAVLAVLGIILALVIPNRKKPEAETESPADPDYAGILADDEESGDPYDRTNGIQPEDNNSETVGK